MSEDEKNGSRTGSNKIVFPDFAELWKELYFKSESAWAEACKEFVSTETFVKILGQTLNQQLSLEKITRQNMDKMFEMSPSTSKKDLARIAELIIAVEEKVDSLDYQLINNIHKMADSMLGMTKLLEEYQNEMTYIKTQNTELQIQIKEIKKQNTDLKTQLSVIKKISESQSQLTSTDNGNRISQRKRSQKKQAPAGQVE